MRNSRKTSAQRPAAQGLGFNVSYFLSSLTLAFRCISKSKHKTTILLKIRILAYCLHSRTVPSYVVVVGVVVEEEEVAVVAAAVAAVAAGGGAAAAAEMVAIYIYISP